MAGELYFINKMLKFTRQSCNNLKMKSVMNEKKSFTVVAQFGSVAEAELAKTRLQDAEIWVDLRNEFMSALNPIAGAVCLVVRTEDEARAKAVLGCK